jgi:hypothetical protein
MTAHPRKGGARSSDQTAPAPPPLSTPQPSAEERPLHLSTHDPHVQPALDRWCAMPELLAVRL